MSSDPVVVGVVYLSESAASRGEAAGSALADLFDRLGIGATRLVVDREDQLDTEEAAVAEAEAELDRSMHDHRAIVRAAEDPTVLSIAATVPGRREAVPRVHVAATTRFPTGAIARDRAPRTIHAIIATGADGVVLAAAADAIAEWLRTCVARLEVLHGGVAVMPSYVEASVEATLIGGNTPREFDWRWAYDVHRQLALWTHARRAYWLTVLGRELAHRAGGSAAARAAGAASVIEESASLIVAATAEPIGNLDPSFLARTSSLRRWLWPFTIQNPVDADFEPATVVLSTSGRLVVESPSLGRHVLLIGLPELAKGDELQVAFPAVGNRLVATMPRSHRTLVFDSDGALVDDYTIRPPHRRRS